MTVESVWGETKVCTCCRKDWHPPVYFCLWITFILLDFNFFCLCGIYFILWPIAWPDKPPDIYRKIDFIVTHGGSPRLGSRPPPHHHWHATPWANHRYTDDTQLFISTRSVCPAATAPWQTVRQTLKPACPTTSLNSTATKLNFSPEILLPSAENFSLLINGHFVTRSLSICCNLGITLDSTHSYKSQSNHITKTSFFHLCNTALLHPSLSQSSRNTHPHIYLLKTLLLK